MIKDGKGIKSISFKNRTARCLYLGKHRSIGV